MKILFDIPRPPPMSFPTITERVRTIVIQIPIGWLREYIALFFDRVRIVADASWTQSDACWKLLFPIGHSRLKYSIYTCALRRDGSKICDASKIMAAGRSRRGGRPCLDEGASEPAAAGYVGGGDHMHGGAAGDAQDGQHVGHGLCPAVGQALPSSSLCSAWSEAPLWNL